MRLFAWKGREGEQDRLTTTLQRVSESGAVKIIYPYFVKRTRRECTAFRKMEMGRAAAGR